MIRITTRGGALAVATAALWALAGGCQNGPFQGQQIAHQTDPVAFGGFTLDGDTIHVQAFNNQSGAWSELTAVGVTPEVTTDGSGANWHAWSTSVTLPTNSRFWNHRGSGSSRFMDITLRSFSDVLQNGLQVMSNLDCIENAYFSTGSGLSVISACGTGNQGTVSVPCGTRNNSCCQAAGSPSLCNSGLACNGGLCVSSGVVVTPPPSGGSTPPMVDPGSSTAPCSSMAGAPCMVHPNECHAGYKDVVGKVVCSNNKASCKAVNGTDYCQFGDQAPPVRCGAAASQSCEIDEQCGPGSMCDQFSHACSRSCRLADGYCWHPRDNPMVPSSDGTNQSGCVGLP